ncbi:hypothetical protein [Anaerosinus massiliensis]|uniref:hypothetical protein n=1 Tax=Massilibacillus massiliensis TaxID=1806837 RepID=UPI000DA60BAB|nr:hypothetical protein [Massilibacillus massiliensis]
MNLKKQKRIRLRGKAVAELNQFIHERDNYTCVVPGCGKHVPIGEKWHHEPCGVYKEDIPEKGCLLCYKHHQQRDGKNSAEIREACEGYLNNLYF